MSRHVMVEWGAWRKCGRSDLDEPDGLRQPFAHSAESYCNTICVTACLCSSVCCITSVARLVQLSRICALCIDSTLVQQSRLYCC